MADKLSDILDQPLFKVRNVDTGQEIGPNTTMRDIMRFVLPQSKTEAALSVLPGGLAIKGILRGGKAAFNVIDFAKSAKNIKRARQQELIDALDPLSPPKASMEQKRKLVRLRDIVRNTESQDIGHTPLSPAILKKVRDSIHKTGKVPEDLQKQVAKEAELQRAHKHVMERVQKLQSEHTAKIAAWKKEGRFFGLEKGDRFHTPFTKRNNLAPYEVITFVGGGNVKQGLPNPTIVVRRRTPEGGIVEDRILADKLTNVEIFGIDK